MNRWPRITILLLILIASLFSLASGTIGPIVKKWAYPSYKLTHQWDIDKTASATYLTLAPGQTYLLDYDVQLTHGEVASNWHVSGYGWIINPSLTEPMILNSVNDVITPDELSVDLSCHWGNSTNEIDPTDFEIPANHTLVCDYDAVLTDGTTRMNTMVANVTVPGGSATDIIGTATIDFSNADVEDIDECVDVVDSYDGLLGTVCGTDQTFSYIREIRYDTCGEYSLVNTATFTTNDTGAVGSASWTVNVWVPCDGGCTLTPGYWKTHSSNGPAPYDNTWAQLGEDTSFFLSGQSYYEALWTVSRGNAYYILAPAYIAVKLNVHNGADMGGAVASAYSAAEGLFTDYTPEYMNDLSKKDELRAQFIALASLLDDYNNGLVGPGHCSE